MLELGSTGVRDPRMNSRVLTPNTIMHIIACHYCQLWSEIDDMRPKKIISWERSESLPSGPECRNKENTHARENQS